MASSFKKKGKKPAHPLGSRPSLYNAQLLVSSGIPSMDLLLGGGLAVGSVLLVEEDVYGSYSRLMMKYFLSEGVMCGHALLLASANERTEDILQDLPGSIEDKQEALLSQTQPRSRKDEDKEEGETHVCPPTAGPGGGGGRVGETEMKIAWRYQNLPKVQSLPFSNQFGHFYDLTVRMPQTRVAAVQRTHFNALDNHLRSARELYIALKGVIENTISEGHFSTDEVASKQRNILRIGLSSLGSPLWLDEVGVASNHSLLQFLHCLRALLRRAYAVAVVTVPTHLMMQDDGYVRRLYRMCDAAVKLESFAGSSKETNPFYKDYHGLFHLQKLPCLNSLISYHPDSMDLAFKLRRKKFSIEKLHLPPEFSDTASRAQEEMMKISKSDITTKEQGREQTVGLKKLSARDIDF